MLRFVVFDEIENGGCVLCDDYWKGEFCFVLLLFVMVCYKLGLVFEMWEMVGNR